MTNIRFTDDTDRALASYARKFQKTSPSAKRALDLLSKGKTVSVEDARSATFEAMQASVTANGQSMGRRADAEMVQRLWAAVHTAEISSLVSGGSDDAAMTLVAIRNAQSEIDGALGTIKTLRARLDAANKRAADLEEEVRDNHRQAVEEGARLYARIAQVEEERDAAYASLARLTRVLDYTREECVAGPVEKAQSFGFEDGINQAQEV